MELEGPASELSDDTEFLFFQGLGRDEALIGAGVSVAVETREGVGGIGVSREGVGGTGITGVT